MKKKTKKAKKTKKTKKPARRTSNKKPSTGRRAAKKKSGKKVAAKKRQSPRPRKNRKQGQQQRAAFEQRPAQSRSGAQSGDLQGLRDTERADSESVDELLEEGNAFEAEAVAGVEQADDEEEREVHTHEVPEDDVPGEYLDKD